MATRYQSNTVVTDIPIDTATDVAEFRVLPKVVASRAKDVAIHVEGTAAASYQVEFGETDDAGIVHWFAPADYGYASTQEIHDGWVQPESLLRLVVTSPATAGATATVLVSEGR